MTTDSREPIGAASPIGKRSSGKITEAQYAPGILTSTIEHALCTKDHIERPQQLKYPLKQKWIQANTQSVMYARMY